MKKRRAPTGAVTIVSEEEFDRRRRSLPWPRRLRHKMRVQMRLRHLAFWLRHPRVAAARRNGTF